MATLPPSEKPSGTDEELTLARDRVERALTNGDKHNLPTHVQHSDLENVELKHSDPLTTAWNRFNGYGRKRIGFIESVKAVIFSSCTSTPTVLGCCRNLLRIPRFERVIGFSSTRLGFPLRSLGRQQDLCVCVPSLGSWLIVRLLIRVDFFGSVCFLSIIPLERLFDWCGEQMAIYLGSSLGDLLIITLNNTVEATLAIILLTKCE